MNEQIDVEKTLVHGTEEELNALKSFLFQENIRLEIERQAQQDKEKSLLALEEDLEKRKQQFIQDKFTFQKESDILKHRMTTERQKLTQDNLFFDKKMEILKGGFAQLEADRRTFEREKKEFYQKLEEGRNKYSSFADDTGAVFFRGVTNILALKKRYRDLCKIFHPDNIAGDNHIFRLVTEEYESLLEVFKNRAAY